MTAKAGAQAHAILILLFPASSSLEAPRCSPTRIAYAPVVRLMYEDYFRIAYTILLNQSGIPDQLRPWQWTQWPVAPQKLGGQYIGSDFLYYWGPADILNGDFEQPANQTSEDTVGWRWAFEQHVADTSLGRSMRVSAMSEGTFQSFSVSPDEEIVVSGKIMTPSERPLAGPQSGVMAVRYLDNWSRTLALYAVELSSAHDPDVWHEFTLDTRVPPFARFGHVELRLLGGGQGSVYFDDISIDRLVDSSGNGISDRTALHLGLDPNDRSIAYKDPTGDGMTIIERIRLGLDPFTSDTSGSGIPDTWQILHGFNPLDSRDIYERRHPDAMSAYEAYHAGLDPHETIDPDGDGLPTALELILGTDPFSPSPEAWTALGSINPATPLAMIGEWILEANHVQSESLRGSLDYLLEIENQGIHGIELHYQQWEPASFDILINGVLVRSFEGLSPETTEIRALLPWLPEGPHILTIRWKNFVPDNMLVINQIVPARVHAPGTHPAAPQEWASEWVRRTDYVGQSAITSVVSPFRLEGGARHTEWTALSPEIPVQPSEAHRWYADIPLDLDAPVIVDAAFQNGARAESVHIAWEPLDAFQARDIHALVGLTLALHVPADTELHLGGLSDAILGAGVHTVVLDHAGTLRATLSALDESDSVLNEWDILVLAPENVSPVAAWRGIERLWPQLDIPDESRWASTYPNRMTDRQTSVGNHGYRFKTLAARDGHIALRTQDDALLLMAAPIRGFDFFSAPDTPLTLRDTLEDGTQLIEAVIVMDPVIDEIEAKYDILTPGVTFDDGSLHRTITAADLDETGTVRLTFLRSPDVRASTCHLIRIYQGDYLLGFR